MFFFIPNRFKHLVKESVWVVLGQFVTLVGSLVLVRVLTNYLNPSEYGQLALSLTALGLISQVVMNSVSASIGRFLPEAIKRQELPQYKTAAKKLLLLCASVSLLTGLTLSLILWFNKHNDWAWLCLLGFVLATVSLYNFTANTVQNAARNRSIVALHSSLESWLKIAFGIAFVLFLGSTASSALLGYVVAICLILVSQIYFLQFIGASSPNQPLTTPSNSPSNFTQTSQTSQNHTPWLQDIWQFAWPFATWGIFIWAQQVSDLWALKIFTNASEVGLYTVVFQLGYAPIILLNTVVQVFLGPILNQKIEQKDKIKNALSVHRTTWLATFVSLGMTVVAFTVAYMTHDWLFSILVADEFRSVSVALPYMVLAGGFFSAGHILSLKQISAFNAKSMLFVKIVTALFGLTLNIVGAWAFGTPGVVGSMVIISISYFAWMAWLTWRLPV
jgi:O-antigen/teichoic acid export membrane protein